MALAIRLGDERMGRWGGSAALVIVLHIGFVVAFLAMTQFPLALRRERETTLVFVPLPEIPASRRPLRAPSGGAAIAAPVPTFEVPVIPSAPDVSALGQALVACRPENLGNLPEDERRRCHLALGNPGLGGWQAYHRLPSQSQYAALWAETLKRREAPVRVACTGTMGGTTGAPSASNLAVPKGGSSGLPSPMARGAGIQVDLICAGALLLKALNR
jgi:hypothetical protein